MKVLAIIGLIFGVLFGLAGILVLSSIINGYVLSVLWAWFIAPTFGLPTLSIPVAIGLSMVAAYLTYQYDGNYATKEDQTWWSPLLFIVLRPLLALGLGAIVHSFV